MFDALLISNQDKEIEQLFKTAKQFSVKSNNKALELWINTQIGFYYYSIYDYDKASDYFLKTSRSLNEMATNEMFDAQNILMKNAYFFQTIKEYEQSIIYLKRAIQITSKKETNYPNFLNALGNCYYEIGNKKAALQNFELAKIVSEDINDTLRYAKVIGDIAKIYIDENRFLEAEKLLKEDILLSKEIKNTKNLIFAKLRLAQLYIVQKRFKEASYLLDKSQELAKNTQHLKTFYFDALVLNLPVVCKESNIFKELLIRRKIDSLRPIIENINGYEALNRVNWKIQTEKMQLKLETELLNTQKANFFRSTFILISSLLLLLVVLLFIIYKRRLKIQQITFDNTLLNSQIEQLKTENALNEANDSLKSIKEYLIDKNQQIVDLEGEIRELEFKFKSDMSQEKLALDKLISSHLMTEDNWSAFKQSFIKEQPEVYNLIKTNYKDLSESNLRIVLLQKIGLNNQEIANLLGITIHGVKKAKQRLRVKYGDLIFDPL